LIVGIRFHCPNGHKLNVKSFLAGKRGICPKCGVKLVIPAESESDSDVLTADPVASPSAELQGAQRGSATSTVPTVSNASDATHAEEDAHWFLCPPTGGQYGPVNRQTMDEWIAEGRVTGDSLVWRNGWPDWQTADKVFSTLPKSSKKLSAPTEEVPKLLPTSNVRTNRRRTSERTTMTAVVLLLLAVILLGGALVLAMTRP
jgi:hypothetical protein